MKGNKHYCIKYDKKLKGYIVCKANFKLFGKPFFYTPCIHVEHNGRPYVFGTIALAKIEAENHSKGLVPVERGPKKEDIYLDF